MLLVIVNMIEAIYVCNWNMNCMQPNLTICSGAGWSLLTDIFLFLAFSILPGKNGGCASIKI
jgi:hypothetical protein